jgi:AGZA family xanthine/uracil permease-like MFS transporter
MMITPITEIDFTDYSDAIPAFLTILFMVCASSISDGIMFGILSYVVMKLSVREFRSLQPTIWVVTILFIAKIIISAL